MQRADYNSETDINSTAVANAAIIEIDAKIPSIWT